MVKTSGSSTRFVRWGSLAQVLAGIALSVACSSTPQVINGDGPTADGSGDTSGTSNNGGTGNDINVPPTGDAGSSNLDPGAGGDDNPDAPVCGDGKVGSDEGCDDGNAKSGDGCD